MIVFLDTEFTDLLHPQLMSLALVAGDGREHYVELDLTSDDGRARVAASSDFVRYGGVLDLWGRVPGAGCTAWEMGRRTGKWLLGLAAECGERVEVAFDYSTDFGLLEEAVRDAGLWDRVREVVWPVNVASLVGTVEGELAAEACLQQLAPRSLARHHALADALALRAAYLQVKASAMAWAGRSRTDNEVVQRTTAPPPVLFLDFDGVLHPDEVYLERGRPVLRSSGELFMWAPLLVDALADHPEVRIVLSTSWARVLGFSKARDWLPRTLRDRVIGATWHSAMGRCAGAPLGTSTWWDQATRYAQIARYVQRAGLLRWVAVEDQPEGWSRSDLDKLVRTHPQFGLSSAIASGQLAAQLARISSSRRSA